MSMACGHMIHLGTCSEAKLILQSLEKKLCSMAWEKFNKGYNIANSPFIGGDLGSRRVEVCSTGFYIIYFNLDCSSGLFYDLKIFLHNACFFFFPGHWKLLIILASHHLDPKVVDLKWVAEVLVKLGFTHSAPSLRYYFFHSFPF